MNTMSEKKSKKKPTSVKKPPVDREVSIVENLRKIEGSKHEGVMLMSGDLAMNIPKRSSGVLSLDIVIGGGNPYGKIIEVFGPEGSGKTTLTLHAIEATQRAGGVGMFIDAEHALNLQYAEGLGVNTSKLILNQPSCGEEALELIVDAAGLMKPGDLIVVDSVAALTPKAEIDGEMGASHMGLQARLMSQAMRKLASVLSKSGVTVIFINQIRSKIGIVFGSPETTSGGNALKFYSSVRIKVTRTSAVKRGTDVIGNGVKIKCIKNKYYPPFREMEATLRYGQGIPRYIDILTVAKLIGLVETSGSWLSYQGTKLGQGIDNAAEAVKEDFELLDEIEQKILEIYKIKRN